MIAHPAIDPAQFLVRETELGLADGQELVCFVPAAEGVVAIVAGPRAGSALRVHQHAIGGERIALPLVPESRAAPRDIRAVAPLEHHALDGSVPSPSAHFLQLFEAPRPDRL